MGQQSYAKDVLGCQVDTTIVVGITLSIAIVVVMMSWLYTRSAHLDVAHLNVNDIDRLRRLLCFGSEEANRYVAESVGQGDPGMQNAECVNKLIAAGRGQEVVKELVSFSVDSRAAKQASLLYVLAVCARSDDPSTKQAAYEALNRVCRIPTHLFQFIELCQKLSSVEGTATGWGRAHRKAIR